MNWINVRDKMPDDDVLLWVAFRDTPQSGRGMDIDWIKDGKFVNHGDTVSHWMLIPEFPPDA